MYPKTCSMERARHNSLDFNLVFISYATAISSPQLVRMPHVNSPADETGTQPQRLSKNWRH